MEPRYKNEKYLAWVRTRPCANCNHPDVVPHHLKGIGHMSGTSLTAPDWATMPLCHICHREMHDNPEFWSYQWEFIARTLGVAIELGILTMEGKK